MVEFEGVEIGKPDNIGNSIIAALRASGSKPYHWEEVTVEEAWKFAAGGVAEWWPYLNDRNSIHGGLSERYITNVESHKLVAVAFFALKNIDRPDGWRKGTIGMKGGRIFLGSFTIL